MRRVIPVVAIVGAFWTADVIAQGRNFGGNWTVDVERTSAANASAAGAGGEAVARGGRGGAGGGGTMVAAGTTTGAVAGERTVAVAGGGGGRGGGAIGAAPAGAGIRSGGGPTPTVIAMNAGSFTIGSGETATTYKTDGSVQTITNARGQEVKAKATWKADKLVIETTLEGPNGPQTATNTWYLEGEALVRETNSTTAAGQSVSRKTYFKKG